MKRLLAIVLLAAACAGMPQNEDTLGESIRAYNDGIRWGRYGVAAGKVPVKERAQFVEEMDERADKVKITDYEVVDVNARGTREARVRIKIGWYASDEGTVHETHAVQTWERTGKLWFMVGEKRVRGKEMPGLPEPADGSPAPAKTSASDKGKPKDSRTSHRTSISDEGSDQGSGRGTISP
jgi:hypothetical protein